MNILIKEGVVSKHFKAGKTIVQDKYSCDWTDWSRNKYIEFGYKFTKYEMSRQLLGYVEKEKRSES